MQGEQSRFSLCHLPGLQMLQNKVPSVCSLNRSVIVQLEMGSHISQLPLTIIKNSNLRLYKKIKGHRVRMTSFFCNDWIALPVRVEHARAIKHKSTSGFSHKNP